MECYFQLTKSQNTVNSTEDLIKRLTKDKLPDGFVIVDFDVSTLLANVPLDTTIEIILRRIYEHKEITEREELKKLLTLCTRIQPFTFNRKVYEKNDGAAMGSPLGPTLANVNMVTIEQEMKHNT